MKHIPLPADQILGDKSISSMFLASNDSSKPKSPPRNRCGRENKESQISERIQTACRLVVVMVWHKPKPGRQGSVGKRALNWARGYYYGKHKGV